MATFSKKFQQETSAVAETEGKRRVRITLNSTDMKAVERVGASFVNVAKSRQLHTKGPIRLPVRKLTVTTRKSPCGQGSKTWDRFEMRLYKRVIEIFGTPQQMASISNQAIAEHNVDVDVFLCED